jgi:tungstate transport system substrate-binding protein
MRPNDKTSNRTTMGPVWWLFSLFVLAGCSGDSNVTRTLILATTTSTRDSGLLDVLIPQFERESGVRVRVIAVGSGQAIELGRRGDADVLLTHSPELEEQFMRDGLGEQQHALMYNDYVLVGPEADPAQASQASSFAAAFRKIHEAGSPFVSRGDHSGTHQREMAIWHDAGLEPSGPWYLRGGSGMAETLRIADQKQAYTVADQATWLASRRQLDLQVVSSGDPMSRNWYRVTRVRGKESLQVPSEAAGEFIQFLLSEESRRTIARFGIEEFGEPLFFLAIEP